MSKKEEKLIREGLTQKESERLTQQEEEKLQEIRDLEGRLYRVNQLIGK